MVSLSRNSLPKDLLPYSQGLDTGTPTDADETSIRPYQAFLHDPPLYHNAEGIKFPPSITTSSSKILYAAYY